MKEVSRDHELIVQYLLGELSEEEKMRLEQQYFADDDFFEQLLIVEGDLIDSYVRAELYGGERQRFETFFLASPPRRQRVELARALVEHATESSLAMSAAAQARKPSPWWQSLRDMLGARHRAVTLAFAAAVLVIAVGGSLLIVETLQLRNRVEHLQSDRAEALRREQELKRQLAEHGSNSEQLADELGRERSQRELLEQELAKAQRSTLSAITFILTPDLVRGTGEPKRLTIPPRADLVRMRLEFDRDDHKSYRGVIETVEGNRIWSSGSLKARPVKSGKAVTLGVPASLFAKGDYILTLSGVNADGSSEPVGEYYFNIVRK